MLSMFIMLMAQLLSRHLFARVKLLFHAIYSSCTNNSGDAQVILDRFRAMLIDNNVKTDADIKNPGCPAERWLLA